jgi:hypothetical protein
MKQKHMKTLFKPALHLIAIAALCAALSACSQPGLSNAAGFPSYGNQTAASGQFEAPSIMDY